MPNTAGNPLSAGSLALFMATSLPRDLSPQLKSPYDAIALAVHAGMIAVGFRLVGLGEDHRLGTSQLTLHIACIRLTSGRSTFRRTRAAAAARRVERLLFLRFPLRSRPVIHGISRQGE